MMVGRRRARCGTGDILLALTLCGVRAACSGQSAGAQLTSSSGNTALGERVDPSTGDRWLLVPNPGHPEGPGRWVRAAGLATSEKKAGSTAAVTGRRLNRDATRLVVIQPGDRVVVEEHSAVVDAHLEAVALNVAARGDGLRVRLAIGGKVVQVVALERGRVRLAMVSGSER